MATRNEIKVELTGVHLCCQGCVNAADAALMSVEGVHSRCDMENGTVTLTAKRRRGGPEGSRCSRRCWFLRQLRQSATW